MQEHTTTDQPDPEYPPFIPLKEAGDVAEGVIERWSSAPSKFNPDEDVVIAVLRQPDGSLGSFWLNDTVRRSQFARLKPHIGERVRYTSKGKREGASGFYNDGVLEVLDREPFVPDWGAIATETEQP